MRSLVDQRPLGQPIDRRQHVERLAQALVALALRAQPAAQRQGEGGVAVGRAGPRQPDHVVRVAGEAVQQDHRRIGRRAGLRLEEVAAQGHAVTGHLHLLGIGHFGQVVPAMRHLDRHAVGIAEGDRVVARREVVELLGRLQDLRPGVAQLGEHLVDLGAALGRDREPQRARAVGDAVLGLAHDEVVVAARPHHAVRARPRRGGSPAWAATGDGTRPSGRGRSLRSPHPQRRNAVASAHFSARAGRAPLARRAADASSPARKNSSSCGGLTDVLLSMACAWPR